MVGGLCGNLEIFYLLCRISRWILKNQLTVWHMDLVLLLTEHESIILYTYIGDYGLLMIVNMMKTTTPTFRWNFDMMGS